MPNNLAATTCQPSYDQLRQNYLEARRRADKAGYYKLERQHRGRLRQMGRATLDVPGAAGIANWVQRAPDGSGPVTSLRAVLVRPRSLLGRCRGVAGWELVEAPTLLNRARTALGLAPLGRPAPSSAAAEARARRLPAGERAAPIWRAIDLAACGPTAAQAAVGLGAALACQLALASAGAALLAAGLPAAGIPLLVLGLVLKLAVALAVWAPRDPNPHPELRELAAARLAWKAREQEDHA